MSTIKTVGDLIAQLSHINPDTPIAIASQPAWPLEHTLSAAALASDGRAYLAASEPVGYLGDAGRTALDW